MKRLLCCTILTLSLYAALLSPCHAQQPPDVERKPAEALLQEVNTALAARPPLKANLTWIKSYCFYGASDGSIPNCQRSKTPVVVFLQNAGMDQFVSTRGKSFKEAPSDVLRHFGDPFIPYFRSGNPKSADPTLYVGELHRAGTEKKNGAVYQVLEAKVVIVSYPAVSPQPLSQPQALKARLTITNWKWDIGSDNLVHRFTWENHEDEGVLRSVEQNEVIVNRFYFQ